MQCGIATVGCEDGLMVGTLAFKPRVDGFESRFAHSNQLLQSNIAIQQNGNLLWSLRPAPFWRTVYPRGSLAPLCALLILATVLPTEWCTICCGPSLTRRHFVRGRDIPSCSSDHVFTFCWILQQLVGMREAGLEPVDSRFES